MNGDDTGERTQTDASNAAENRIVTAENREWTTTERGDREFRRANLGAPAAGEKLGCSLYEMPPGKRAWPYHFHVGNEEAVFVLSGEATIRTPDGETTVFAGTYASFPTGEDGAHEIQNAGDEPLRYLVVSTMQDPDVVGYPDSEKVGVLAGSPPGGESDERIFSSFFPEDADVDYWDGEVDESSD